MATLLGDVVQHLQRNGTQAVLIGAEAMSFHGIVRATVDIDLLTVSKTILSHEFWRSLENATVDVRHGDHDDPLAGVVKVKRGEKSMDIVVGKYKFAAEIVDRSETVTVEGVTLRVVRLADLVLLKLFAGGPQDAWDIHQMLSVADENVISEIETRLPSLPADAQQLWTRIRAERG